MRAVWAAADATAVATTLAARAVSSAVDFAAASTVAARRRTALELSCAVVICAGRANLLLCQFSCARDLGRGLVGSTLHSQRRAVCVPGDGRRRLVGGVRSSVPGSLCRAGSLLRRRCDGLGDQGDRIGSFRGLGLQRDGDRLRHHGGCNRFRLRGEQPGSRPRHFPAVRESPASVRAGDRSCCPPPPRISGNAVVHRGFGWTRACPMLPTGSPSCGRRTGGPLPPQSSAASPPLGAAPRRPPETDPRNAGLVSSLALNLELPPGSQAVTVTRQAASGARSDPPVESAADRP